MFNDNWFWTEHAKYKMKQYGLSEQRVKRVIRAPFRIEEGIVKNTVAVMIPAGNFTIPKKDEKPAWKQEIWAMYQIGKHKITNSTKNKQNTNYEQGGKLRVISAWRYPGVSPKNNPIPEEIIREISSMR